MAGLPPRRKKLRPRKRGNAPALHAAPRCNANTSSSCKGSPCEAPALNENTRKRLSEQLGYDVPAGLCAHHVKEHARKFHGIPPTWNFAGARLCGKLTYKSRRTIPCRNPCMRGRSSCNVHGARGAEHGYKGVGPWNSEGGKLGWEKRRAPQDGAYRGQPKFKNVRVKKGERRSYAERLLNPKPRAPQQSVSDQDYFSQPMPRKKLGPLYPA